MKGVYKTTTIGVEIETTFDCDLVINSPFPKLYISALMHTGQEVEAIGMWCNIRSLTWEEQDCDYIEDYVDNAGYNETREHSEAITTIMPTAQTTVNPCKPGPNMKWTQCMEFAVPYPFKGSIAPLTKPWGHRCPKELHDHI